MPELPEVQTLINSLNSKDIFNSPIVEINIFKTKILKNSSQKDFVSFLLNKSIESISRNGKYLIFNLSGKSFLVVHLRMEGKIFIDTEKKPSGMSNKHLMVNFVFKNGNRFNYFDTRMFGTFHIFENDELKNESEIMKNVGVDPFSSRFNVKYLSDQFLNKKQAIKTVLLNQKIIAGIGNIYADEILFATKISPLLPANKLTQKDISNIIVETKRILKLAIANNGTTIFSFKYDANHSGNFQNQLLVHSHKNDNCKVCNCKILKIKVNGRGTYYCPNCQKL